MLVFGLLAAGVLWKTRWWRPPPAPRPLSPDAPDEQRVIAVLLLAALGMWVGQMLLATAFASAWAPAKGVDPTLRSLGMINCATYGVAAIVLLAFLASGPRWIEASIGAAPTGRSARNGVVAAVVILPIVAASAIFVAMVWTTLQGSPPPQVAHDTLAKLAAGPMADPNPDNRGLWWWMVVASVVFGAPVIEEFIYRGFLQTAVSRATGSPRAAIVVTSLLFTLVHVGIADLRALPILLVLSVGMGIAYERSGRLLTPILVHMLFNATNVATAVLQNST